MSPQTQLAFLMLPDSADEQVCVYFTHVRMFVLRNVPSGVRNHQFHEPAGHTRSSVPRIRQDGSARLKPRMGRCACDSRSTIFALWGKGDSGEVTEAVERFGVLFLHQHPLNFNHLRMDTKEPAGTPAQQKRARS